MRSFRTIRVALLGTVLGFAALAPAFGANTLDAASKRLLAAHGPQGHAFRNGGIAAPGNSSFTYTDLHDFAGQPDGLSPTAEVTLDGGNLFGTTEGGGANGEGAIFKVTSDGTESVLYSLAADGSEGQSPDGALTITANGDMYGTTSSGIGAVTGVLFKLSAKGKYKILHAFNYNEGTSIRGKLVRDTLGNLYGTALFGGAPGNGTVFKYSANGTFSVLHAFNETDGQYPEHGLVRDSAGNLYGVTAFGGASGMGAVYKIASDGTFSTVYSFTGGADGGFLYGSVAIGKDGNLYGSTVLGGANSEGTVFKLTPAGTLTTLYNFTGGADGGSAQGDMLVVGNNLYSTTDTGGDPNCGCGVVYEVTPEGKEKVLHTFVAATGGGYSAGLTKGKHGALYGTTSSYGADSSGTVFSITKN